MARALSPTTIKRKTPTDNYNRNQAKKAHWSLGLSEALNDESVQLYKDDLCTVIKDKYPKVGYSIHKEKFIFYSTFIIIILGSFSFTCTTK